MVIFWNHDDCLLLACNQSYLSCLYFPVHQFSLDNHTSQSQIIFDVLPAESRFGCFSLKFSPDILGSEILAGGSDCCIYIYDRCVNRRTLRVRIIFVIFEIEIIEDLYDKFKIKAHEDDVNAVCFAGKTSDIFYTGSDDGIIKVNRRFYCTIQTFRRKCLN